MLSRLVITFLPRRKCLLISWLQSPPSAVILEPRKIVSHCFRCFPIYLPWSDGTDAMILVFWMLNFKPTFSFSSFTFIKRLFSSSSLYAIRVVSSAYMRLLIFLPAILIPACASSSPAFLMMYSAYIITTVSNSSFPLVVPLCWYISISILFLATYTLLVSPVRITSKILHGNLQKNPSFEMHFFIG